MVQAAEVPTQSGQTVGTWGSVTRSYERRLRAPPALMESIPDTRPGDRQEERETDFGDLIERELIIPSLRNSVFRGIVKDRDSEIVPRLEELRAMMADRPKKTIE